MDTTAVTEYQDITRIVVTNIPIVLFLITICFIVIGKLFHVLWKQHKDFNVEKRQLNKEKDELKKEVEEKREEIEKSEISRVVDKIEDLVEQIKFLFTGQREMNAELSDVKLRVGNNEKKIASQCAICKERVNIISDIKERQDYNIAKFDKALIDRAIDVKRVDRTDREN